MKKLALIGAGVAGLSAARLLADTSIDITILDKSRGVGGRAASRSRHGARYDYGANYIKCSSPEMEAILCEQLPGDELVNIEPGISVFDQYGVITAGDPAQNRVKRWTYSSGISSIAKHLRDDANLQVEQETRILSLNQHSQGWQLVAETPNPKLYQFFDAVLLTTPAPQSIDILRDSVARPALKNDLVDALGQASYNPQMCFILGFDNAPVAERDFFALINTDRKHNIAFYTFKNNVW